MMYQFRLDEHNVHRSIYHRLRMQLAWTVTASLFIPVAIYILLRGLSALDNASTLNTVALSLTASTVTLLVLRQVSSILRLVLFRWVLPVYVTAFASLVSLVVFLRLPYSAVLMGLSLAITAVSFFMLTALMARNRQAVCYVVPLGRAETLDFAPRLHTIVLDRPRLPAVGNAIIVADLHAELNEDWERLLTEAALNDYPIYHISQLREAVTGQVQFDHLSENSFGALIPTLTYKKIKRLIDIVGTVIFLPVLLPMMLIIAVAIKLDSPGPALFKQRRMGYRGRMFSIIKFRTMTVTEDGGDHRASITQDNDQRITRLGKLLRATRLDELPQAFNILAGEMSWIGPRPEAVSLSHEYSCKIPNYRYRHLVRPGITGWAQVHQGHVTTLDGISDKLRYDFYYVKNISLWLDVVIALRTIRVMITGFGAR